jgi:hypothetical protein
MISFISVAARRDAAQPWLYHDGDAFTPTLARWIATGIMSILTDIIVTAMSIYLVWDLNMASKSKSLVITAFTLRLFVTPVTIARLVTLSHVQVDDLSFSYSLPEVMTQLEMYCNLITTTLPCLRLFLTAWNSSFMDIGLAGIDHDAYREREPLPVPHSSLHFEHKLTALADVTTLSSSASKDATSASRSGIHSKNRASRSARAAWTAPTDSGKSKAFVETGTHDRDSDAASDNSERAIVVKRTVDVSDGTKF